MIGNSNRDYYDYIGTKKTKKSILYRFIRSLLITCFLLICLLSCLFFFQIISIDQVYKHTPAVPHKLQSLTFNVNNTRLVTCSSGNVCVLSPADRVIITSIKTDGVINLGIKLYSTLFDIHKIEKEPLSFLDLCPQLSFEEPQIIEISAIWLRWNLGTIKMTIKWPARHWIDRATLTKDIKKREYFLLKALKEDPNHPIARVKLAETYFKAGNFSEAAKEYEKIIVHGPSKQILNKIIECYKRLGHKRKVVDTYIRAINLFHDASYVKDLIIYLKASYQPRKIKAVLEKRIDKLPDDLKPNFWLFLTDVCTQIKDWKCVVKYSEKARKKISLGPTIEYNLAVAYFQKKDYNKALTHLATYLRTNPDDIDALRLKANCYEKLQKWNMAEKVYFRLVQKRPSDEFIAAWIKSIQIQNNTDRMLQAYKYLTKIKPNDWIGWYNLGILHYKEGNLDKAISELNHALELKPDNAEIIKYIVKIYHDQKKPEEELKALEKLISLEPNNILHYESYFNVANEAKKILNLENIMNQCVQNNPEEPKCYDMLLFTLLKHKKKKEAAKILQKLISLKPNNLDLILQLAKLNYDTRNYDEALENLRKYLEAKPDDTKAKNLYLQVRLKLLKLKRRQ